MRYEYGTPQSHDTFEELVQRMPTSEFSKLDRSTIPLLCWWRDEAHVAELMSMLGLGSPHRTVFEYPVRSGCSRCQGRGKSSFTDVMLTTDEYVVAIEAKYREALYQTVRQWLAAGGPRGGTNRRSVLHHWLSCCLGLEDRGEYGELIYQMVHRTASAAFFGKRSRQESRRGALAVRRTAPRGVRRGDSEGRSASVPGRASSVPRGLRPNDGQHGL